MCYLSSKVSPYLDIVIKLKKGKTIPVGSLGVP
jgi:hypothetical protein